MKIKEYPEIEFDVFPRLYEHHSKVFLTHLYQAENHLTKLPKQFCKMYTTQRLANQLKIYLSRKRQLTDNDFVILKPFEPTPLKLSTGVRLEVMICEGNLIANSLIVLIRKDGKLLYFYSALQQDNLHKCFLNDKFASWTKNGTDELFLNLQQMNSATNANEIEQHYETLGQSLVKLNRKCRVFLPCFGYENFLWQLVKDATKSIAIAGRMASTFKELNVDMSCFKKDLLAAKLLITGVLGDRREVLPADFNEYEVFHLHKKIDWSPLPSLINLHTICSMLCPRHIHVMNMENHTMIVRPPRILYQYCTTYKPKSPKKHINQISTPTTTTAVNRETPKTSEIKIKQRTSIKDRNSDNIRFMKKRQLCYVEESSEDAN